MKKIIKKIKTVATYKTTFRVGLLQSKAYRILHQNTTKHLVKLNIGPVRWALLGLLYDNKNGLMPSEIAHELGVEAPFITATVEKLKKSGFIKDTVHLKDSRAKIIHLTPKGKEFVLRTEISLKEKMKPMLKDISPKELIDYFYVLQKIIENEEGL